jgi:endonuclease/exonuclease/phosphatase family metal-dependent hydrolase
MKEVAKIVEIVKARMPKSEPNAQVIVAGDFNVDPNTQYGQEVLKTLTHIRSGSHLNDVLPIEKDALSAPTHNGYGQYPDAKLDYIFMPSRMEHKQVVESYVAGKFGEEPWESASDHLPCVVVFEEPAKVSKTQSSPKKRVLDMIA